MADTRNERFIFGTHVKILYPSFYEGQEGTLYARRYTSMRGFEYTIQLRDGQRVGPITSAEFEIGSKPTPRQSFMTYYDEMAKGGTCNDKPETD
jgi:hypothetical protein